MCARQKRVLLGVAIEEEASDKGEKDYIPPQPVLAAELPAIEAERRGGRNGCITALCDALLMQM